MIGLVLAVAVAFGLAVFAVLEGRASRRELRDALAIERKRVDDLSAIAAAIPTEHRAIRHGSAAFELDLRGRVHDLANRIVGCEERIAITREQLELGDPDPSTTATGPIDVPPDPRHDSDEDLTREK